MPFCTAVLTATLLAGPAATPPDPAPSMPKFATNNIDNKLGNQKGAAQPTDNSFGFMPAEWADNPKSGQPMAFPGPAAWADMAKGANKDAGQGGTPMITKKDANQGGMPTFGNKNAGPGGMPMFGNKNAGPGGMPMGMGPFSDSGLAGMPMITKKDPNQGGMPRGMAPNQDAGQGGMPRGMAPNQDAGQGGTKEDADQADSPKSTTGAKKDEEEIGMPMFDPKTHDLVFKPGFDVMKPGETAKAYGASPAKSETTKTYGLSPLKGEQVQKAFPSFGHSRRHVTPRHRPYEGARGQ